MTVADYPDFATPQAHATAIAATGVPLLSLPGTMLASTAINIAGGGTQTIANLPITQLGYEIELLLQIPNTATIPFLDVVLKWTDATGNNTVARERWMLSCGSAVNYDYIGTGPTKGSILKITLNNQDPAQTITGSLIVLSNSRIYQRDRWIANQTQSVPTFTATTGDPLREILGQIEGISVAAGTTATRLFPCYHGDVWFYVEQTGIAANVSACKLQTAPTSVLGTTDFYSSAPAGGIGAGIGQLVRFPRAPVLFSYINSGAVAAVVSVKAIMLDDKF